jgi:hypothetical protein
MINPGNVFDGWYNAYFKNDLHPDQQHVAQRRLDSCSSCKYSKEYWIKKVVDTIIDKITGREKKIKERIHGGFKCDICGCPITKKMYSFNEQCPLPRHEGDRYPHAQRWGAVKFDDDGKLIGSDNIYITASTEAPESAYPGSR